MSCIKNVHIILRIKLNIIKNIFQYSLRFFLSVYHTVLYENPQLNTVRDYEQRLQIITQALFKVNEHKIL